MLQPLTAGMTSLRSACSVRGLTLEYFVVNGKF
jgi:hypothetical protein